MCVSMTLVRERRHQRALRLSLPPPIGASYFHNQTHIPPLSQATLPDSPCIETLSDLEKLKVIGHGNGGIVYKVRHKKTSSIYALKALRFDQNAIDIRHQAAREAEILKMVNSPYIIRCHGVFDNGFSDKNNGGDLCFVMEYMEGGSLHDVLRSRQRLYEKLISDLARRVLEGLNYLHGMQIVHRDIKPSNLLINHKGEVKIADFGVSKRNLVEGTQEESYITGTCAYMSPERIDPERWEGDITDGFAGDIWSLGVVVLECLTGQFPLIGSGQRPDWATMMCAICFGKRLEMPETASSQFRSFVSRCLEKDWRRRATVAELLDHPFVNNKSSCHSTQELVDYDFHG